MTATLQIKKDRPNYYILVRYQDENTRKERQKWVTTDILVKGNNKRKAEAKLKEVLAEFERQKIDLSKDILFDVFIDNWLENMKSSIGSSTYDAYKFNVYNRIIPFFKSKKIKVKDLTPSHIQQFTNHYLKTVSANTVRKYLINISKCLDSAVNQNIIAFNPAKRIDLPKKTKYMGAKFYNEKQIEQLLECSKGDLLEMVIILTVFYGLRRSEVLGLKWNAIDFTNDTIAIQHTVVNGDKKLYKKDSTKNDSSYAVMPLPNILKTKLKEWKRKQIQNQWLQPNDYVNEGYVCTYVNGNVLSPNFISQHFQILLKNSDMPSIRFHDLRHSSASYLLSLGFNLKEIQTWLRHGDIQTTMNIYTHIDMEAKRGIAETLNEKFVCFNK